MVKRPSSGLLSRSPLLLCHSLRGLDATDRASAAPAPLGRPAPRLRRRARRPARLHPRPGPGRTRLGRKVPGPAGARLAAVLPPAPRRAAAQPRIALWPGQRRVARGTVPVVGMADLDRQLPGPLPDAKGAHRRAGGTHPIPGGAPGTDPERRPDQRAAEGAAPDLQRLLDRRRRDGPAGVRQLRDAGGLRPPRSDGDLGAGRDRPGALRRRVARPQAQARGGARRRGLPDLFRSAGRRFHRR